MIIGLSTGIGIFAGLALFTFLFCSVGGCYKVASILSIIYAIVFIGGGLFVGKTTTDANYETFIRQHIATQEIYSESLINEKLSGFERVELVKMANEQSVMLEKMKVGANKWWNYGLSKDLIEQIVELKIIK